MPFVLLTLLFAFVLNAVALPDGLADWRPAWVLLVSLYWTIHLTYRIGIVWCWALGLGVDVLTAAPLGLHALCFVLVAGIAWRFSVQLRVFSLLQQGAVVVALVLVAVCAAYVVRWLAGAPPRGMWLGPVAGSAVVWLPVAFCLSRLQAFIEVR